MAKLTGPEAVANRIRAATESLTSTSDLAIVAEYLRELAAIACEQEQDAQERSCEKALIVPLRSIELRGELSIMPAEDVT